MFQSIWISDTLTLHQYRFLSFKQIEHQKHKNGAMRILISLHYLNSICLIKLKHKVVKKKFDHDHKGNEN